MKDVSVQIMALEDEFRRNERTLAIEEAKQAEKRRKEQEAKAQQTKLEEELRKKVEAAEWAESQRRNSPQKTSTLHLLSPKYHNAE